jgi:hypothetical protein
MTLLPQKDRFQITFENPPRQVTDYFYWTTIRLDKVSIWTKFQNNIPMYKHHDFGGSCHRGEHTSKRTLLIQKIKDM